MHCEKAILWWKFWGGVLHREDNPAFEITLQYGLAGQPQPGIRSLRLVPAGEAFSVNFHHVPPELLIHCPSFADVAAARLTGKDLLGMY